MEQVTQQQPKEEPAPVVEGEEGDDVTGLSPETKDFFEKADKPAKKEAQKPAPEKPAQAKKPEPPKDTPEVELERTKAAMGEERARRKEIAEQLRRESEARAKLEERFNRFMQLASQEPERKVPEFEQDPAAHLKARDEQREAELAELRQWREQREAESQQQQQMAGFRNHVAVETQKFMKDAPDYGDAYSFVRELRARELSAIGVPPEHVEQLCNQWEMQLAGAALQLGKNPAAALYAQAEALGYKKKDAKEQPQQQAEQSKLEQLARGAEAAKGLGGGGGAAPEQLSLERIMQMDDDEMADLVKGKNWGKVARMFGRE